MLSPRADAAATQGTAARIAPADIAAVVVSPRVVKRGNELSRLSEDASSRVRVRRFEHLGDHVVFIHSHKRT